VRFYDTSRKVQLICKITKHQKFSVIVQCRTFPIYSSLQFCFDTISCVVFHYCLLPFSITVYCQSVFSFPFCQVFFEDDFGEPVNGLLLLKILSDSTLQESERGLSGVAMNGGQMYPKNTSFYCPYSQLSMFSLSYEFMFY